MNNNIVVETRNLTKVFGDGGAVRALDGVNLIVRQGELLSVMGPSGSGKSTLLHLIGALDRPTEGQILIRGQDLTTVKDLDRFRNEEVGFVFQLHNLIPTLNAVENVEIPLYEQPLSEKKRRQRAAELLELVGMGDRMDHLPSQLSGGERQRVAIARALVNDPAIVLADEPTGNLDSQSGQDVMTLLRELNERQGSTIIVVTHDPAVARSTKRVITLHDGRVARDVPLESPYLEDLRELKDSPLGKSLLEGEIPPELEGLGLEQVTPLLRGILEKV
ncbi:MAG: ABC transporter ATP-binding protein [Anaerolineales bacterium]|nr:MAG: ABC transporter ATP-binding protein [Anaerolineales bacterium]